jgi:hypothetical protein
VSDERDPAQLRVDTKLRYRGTLQANSYRSTDWLAGVETVGEISLLLLKIPQGRDSERNRLP